MSDKPSTTGRYRLRFGADSGRRFYPESDGDPGRRTHYVIDRYADPMSDRRRTDCQSHGDAMKLARGWNLLPPWPVWDTIQAERDGYKHP